jgi:hypothetical protein
VNEKIDRKQYLTDGLSVHSAKAEIRLNQPQLVPAGRNYSSLVAQAKGLRLKPNCTVILHMEEIQSESDAWVTSISPTIDVTVARVEIACAKFTHFSVDPMASGVPWVEPLCRRPFRWRLGYIPHDKALPLFRFANCNRFAPHFGV